MKKVSLDVLKKEFSLCFSATDAAETITEINTKEKYWYTESRRMENPVPNMSGRAPGSLGTSLVTMDKIKEDYFDEAYMLFILKCLKRFPKLTLYVHDGPFGFYPVFGILYKPSLLGEGSYILKFKESSLSKETYEIFIEHLYSKENTNKHPRFKLEAIRDLDHYDY